MKGLLIKDFRLMKNQKNFLFVVLVMAVFLIFVNGDKSSSGSFVLSYIGFVAAFFAVSTINYDEFNNGNTFLFTLPFERKSYVFEKYIFGILTGVAGIACVLSLLIVYDLFRNSGADIKEILFIAGINVGILFFYLSLMFPIQLKFGAEKGRIAMIIAFICIFAVCYGIAAVFGVGTAELNFIAEVLDKIGIWGIFALIIFASIVVMIISAAVSTRIMENKEF